MQLDLLSKKNILFPLSFFEKHDFLKRYLVRKKCYIPLYLCMTACTMHRFVPIYMFEVAKFDKLFLRQFSTKMNQILKDGV